MITTMSINLLFYFYGNILLVFYFYTFFYLSSCIYFRIDSDAKVQQQTETKNINVSLHTFSKVIMSLTSGSGSQHIPYRDSKLTRILQGLLMQII